MKKQLLRFLLVGTSTVLLDFLSYKIFLYFGVSHSLAKTCSFLIGTIYAYFMNKHYTFEKGDQHKTDFVKFMILYLVSLGLNVGVNHLMLQALSGFRSDWVVTVAFLFATGTSTVTNFIGQKFWVFR